MFNDSWNVPSLDAPSPKKHSVTLSSPCSFEPSPAPVATGRPEPTIEVSPSEPTEKSDRCIDPPLPWLTPSTRPNSSAMRRSEERRVGKEWRTRRWTWEEDEQ